MSICVRGNVNPDEVGPVLSKAVDGVVNALYDQAASRLSIMHPGTGINAVINNLISMGIII